MLVKLSVNLFPVSSPIVFRLAYVCILIFPNRSVSGTLPEKNFLLISPKNHSSSEFQVHRAINTKPFQEP